MDMFKFNKEEFICMFDVLVNGPVLAVDEVMEETIRPRSTILAILRRLEDMNIVAIYTQSGEQRVMLNPTLSYASNRDLKSVNKTYLRRRHKDKSKRKHIAAQLRAKVLERDNATCQLCGAKAPDSEIEVDHIKPVSLGGTNNEENLRCLCKKCNVGKGDGLEMPNHPVVMVNKFNLPSDRLRKEFREEHVGKNELEA
jgi:5-methylcytosine-specific restriction endonuclease McrA